jgi:hypothetical protein
MFGGTFDPAYFLTVTAIEQHCLTTTNKRNAALMQSFLSDVLNVPLDRGIVRFNPIPEDCLATGGRTVASNVEKADTDVGVKNPTQYRRKSMRMSVYGGPTSPTEKVPLKEKRKSILNLGRRTDEYEQIKEKTPKEKMPKLPLEIKANSKSTRTRSKPKANTPPSAPVEDPIHSFVQNASPPLPQIGQLGSEDSSQRAQDGPQSAKVMPFYSGENRKSSLAFNKKSFQNNSRPGQPLPQRTPNMHSRVAGLEEDSAPYKTMTPPPVPDDVPYETPRIGKRKSLIALFKRDNNVVKAAY